MMVVFLSFEGLSGASLSWFSLSKSPETVNLRRLN